MASARPTLKPVVMHGDFTFTGGAELTAKILDRHPKVTAIFAAMQRTSAGQRIMQAWEPRDLPAIRQPRRRRREGWPDYVAAIVVQSLFMFWRVGLLPLWPAATP